MKVNVEMCRAVNDRYQQVIEVPDDCSNEKIEACLLRLLEEGDLEWEDQLFDDEPSYRCEIEEVDDDPSMTLVYDADGKLVDVEAANE